MSNRRETLIAAQLIAAYVLGFGAMMIVPVPEGWELVVGAAGIAAGVLLTATLLRGRPQMRHVIATAAGAATGAIAVALLPPMGFKAVLIPVVLATAAYGVTPRRAATTESGV